MDEQIKTGDRVAYSREWLRNTCQLTGDTPHAKGTVKEIEHLLDCIQLAVINWDQPHLPQRVNVLNLSKISSNGVIMDRT